MRKLPNLKQKKIYFFFLLFYKFLVIAKECNIIIDFLSLINIFPHLYPLHSKIFIEISNFPFFSSSCYERKRYRGVQFKSFSSASQWSFEISQRIYVCHHNIMYDVLCRKKGVVKDSCWWYDKIFRKPNNVFSHSMFFFYFDWESTTMSSSSSFMSNKLKKLRCAKEMVKFCLTGINPHLICKKEEVIKKKNKKGTKCSFSFCIWTLNFRKNYNDIIQWYSFNNDHCWALAELNESIVK